MPRSLSIWLINSRGVSLEVGHVGGVLRRDDEAEMMPVALAALREVPRVHLVVLRPEQPGLLPVAGHAVPAQIIEVRAERGRAAGVTDDAGLDDGNARAPGEKAVGLDAGALAAAEARTAGGRDLAGAGHAAAGLLRGRQCLRNEGPRLLRASRTNAPRTDAELALIGYGVARDV